MRTTWFGITSLLLLAGLAAACTRPSQALPVQTVTAPAAPAALTSTAPILAPTPTAAPSPTAVSSPTAAPSPTVTPTPIPAVLIGAGDIAYCGDAPEYQGDEQTAALIEQQLQQWPHAAVFAAGDVVTGEGTRAEYNNCFGPSWGRFKERVRPVPGNHDYMTGGGAPYYEYFGAAAGEPGKGYYSYDLGDWHIVALNSNCDDVACGPNSPQVKWLEEDLRASAAKCTLAYWHHPRFSSGLAGDNGITNPLWRTVVEAGVEVVVGGHDHNYERFAPLNVQGEADPTGTRLFVVGTGGSPLRDFGAVKPHSEVRYSGTNGVIQFKLYPGRYEWQFIPADDAALTDMGSGECR